MIFFIGHSQVELLFFQTNTTPLFRSLMSLAMKWWHENPEKANTNNLITDKQALKI